MSTYKKVFAALALLFLLVAAPASAGVLNGHALSFNDGNGPSAGAWTGTSAYTNGLASPNNLNGTVDYSVMTVADFATAFPTATYVPGGALVYMYQVNNTGTFSLSAEIVGINNPANAIGQFLNTAGEIASSLFGFDTGGNAVWNFTNPFVGTNQSTYILAFSSPNVPMLGASISVNGGTFGVSQVPTPSATAIPEPAGLALIAVGGMLVTFRRRRQR